jgi:membrane fusion protein, heavy metal efflux system
MKNILNVFVGLILICGMGCIVSCHKKEGAAAVVETKKAAYCLSDTLQKMIKIEAATTTNVEDALNLSGEVTFNEDKVIRVMPITSGRVMEVKASLGDYVKAGQTLVVMHSFEIVGSNSDKRTATADVEIYRKNMEAAESLYKSGMMSEKDYLNSKQDYNKALSAQEKSQQIGSLYGSEGSANGEIVIKAPASGYILEKKVASGQVIRTDNADNLFTIGDLSEVWVMANVFEVDISRVREGYNADVKTLAYSDRVFSGKIDKINTVLDPTNKAMKVRIRLQNSGNLLKPQMFTNVIVKNTTSQKAMMVPSSAVIFNNGKNFVVSYVDNCNLKVKEVSILKVVGEKTYIIGGIAEGEKLITRNEVLIYSALTENL